MGSSPLKKVSTLTSLIAHLSHVGNPLPKAKVFSFSSFLFFFFFFFSSHKTQVLFRSLAKLPKPTVPPQIIPGRAQVIGLIGLLLRRSAVRCGLCHSALSCLAGKYLHVSLTGPVSPGNGPVCPVATPGAGGGIAGLDGTTGHLVENLEAVFSPL